MKYSNVYRCTGGAPERFSQMVRAVISVSEPITMLPVLSGEKKNTKSEKRCGVCGGFDGGGSRKGVVVAAVAMPAVVPVMEIE